MRGEERRQRRESFVWQMSRGPKVMQTHLVSLPDVCQGEKMQGERSWKAENMMVSFTCLLPRLIASVLHKSQPPQTASSNSLSALVLAIKASCIKAADNSVSPIAVIATAPARIMTLCPHMSPKVSVSLCVQRKN